MWLFHFQGLEKNLPKFRFYLNNCSAFFPIANDGIGTPADCPVRAWSGIDNKGRFGAAGAHAKAEALNSDLNQHKTNRINIR